MSGISVGIPLLVDNGLATQEVVYVLETTRTSFKAVFEREHDENCAIACSTLVGRQLRLGNTYPIHTIEAVTSSTQLLLDRSWESAFVSGLSYSIIGMYYPIASDIKEYLRVYDPVQPLDLELHYPQDRLGRSDPQRAATGDPKYVSDMYPNEGGMMLYEIYPPQTTARLLQCDYVRQWQDMRKSHDRPPHFVNPNVFIWGAMAQALKTKIGENDPYLDPVTGNYYEQMAQNALELAVMEDDGKDQQTVTNDTRGNGRMGANWEQSHDFSVYERY
jgi:hypothetical protein